MITALVMNTDASLMIEYEDENRKTLTAPVLMFAVMSDFQTHQSNILPVVLYKDSMAIIGRVKRVFRAD